MPDRPACLTVLPGEVPETLTALPQWVVWRNDPSPGGKWRKTPYRSDGAGKARSNDPATWSGFAAALLAYQHGGYDGVGFVFAGGGGLAGIDLDACRDPLTARFTAHAAAVLRALCSYSEISPSGSGVKAFARATKAGARCSWAGPGGSPKVECYERGRFFCVTGRRVSALPAAVCGRQREMDRLFAGDFLVPQPPARPESRRAQRVADRRDAESRAARYLAHCPPAVSGCGGHPVTYAVARSVVWGFDLGARRGFELLLRVYNPLCRPPWSERELWHKVKDADEKPFSKPRGWLL